MFSEEAESNGIRAEIKVLVLDRRWNTFWIIGQKRIIGQKKNEYRSWWEQRQQSGKLEASVCDGHGLSDEEVTVIHTEMTPTEILVLHALYPMSDTHSPVLHTFFEGSHIEM